MGTKRVDKEKRCEVENCQWQHQEEKYGYKLCRRHVHLIAYAVAIGKWDPEEYIKAFCGGESYRADKGSYVKGYELNASQRAGKRGGKLNETFKKRGKESVRSQCKRREA